MQLFSFNCTIPIPCVSTQSLGCKTPAQSVCSPSSCLAPGRTLAGNRAGGVSLHVFFTEQKDPAAEVVVRQANLTGGKANGS